MSKNKQVCITIIPVLTMGWHIHEALSLVYSVLAWKQTGYKWSRIQANSKENQIPWISICLTPYLAECSKITMSIAHVILGHGCSPYTQS